MRNVTIRISVRKEDAAFVYFILEAHEGVCSYSTMNDNDALRIIALLVPDGRMPEAELMLESLQSYIVV